MTLGALASYTAIATFAAVMIYSAVSDVLTLTISDRFLLVLLLAFPVLAPLAGWSPEKMLYAVAAALIAFFGCLAVFALKMMGGGDGKMLTVSILWLGAESSLQFLTAAAFIGGIFALAILIFRKAPLPEALSRFDWILRLHRPDTGVPYGVALGMAGLLLLPQTPWAAGVL